MNKRVIVGELAGFFWLLGDAAWAVGDRLKWENTPLVVLCFTASIIGAMCFIWMQCTEEDVNG